MRSFQVLCFFLLFAVTPLFAVDIFIAPFQVIEAGRKIDMMIPPSVELYQEFWNYQLEPYVFFSVASPRPVNPPENALDVHQLSEIVNTDYLLYGFFERREFAWYYELRLYSRESKKVIRFFYGADTIDDYHRLICDIAEKVTSYFKQEIGINIGDDFRFQRKSMLLVPLQLGYWLPLQEDWRELLIGTVSVSGGVYFAPVDRLFVLHNRIWFLTGGIDLNYQYAFGNPKKYNSFIHTVGVHVPLLLNCKINRVQTFHFGAGLMNAVEFMVHQDIYDQQRLYIFNTPSVTLCTGYSHAITDNFSLFLNNRIEFRFSEPFMVAYTPSFGGIIKAFERKVSIK